MGGFPSPTGADADGEPDAAVAAEVEQRVSHRGGEMGPATGVAVEAGDHAHTGGIRNAGKDDVERIGFPFLAAEFGLGPQHAPVVADQDIDVPTFLVVDDDGVVVEAVHVDLGVLQNDQAGVEADISFAIASLRWKGNSACRDGGRECGVAEMAEVHVHRFFPQF